MAPNLLNILRDAQRELQLSGFERYQFDPSFSEYPAHLYNSIETHFPFNEWADSWLAWGDDGSGVALRGEIGRWLTLELLFGKPPELLVGIVEKLLHENQADFADVYICRGVGVASREDLSGGAYLLNPNLLTEINNAAQLFAPPSGMNISKACSALVLPFHMEAILFKPGAERPQISSASAQVRTRFAASIRQALILSGSVAVRLPGKLRISQTPGYPYRRDQLDVFEGEAAIAVGSNPDLVLARSLITLLGKFCDPRPINIALDRVNRARSASSDTDAAIDYGIALEVTLMHGDATANQEISNKLGMRAGWLLGTDVQNRLDVKSKVSRLYAARSDAAHRGYLRDETQRRFSRYEADELVVRCLLSILEKQKFPDWTKLQFGDLE
jgi:hypothetical protein